MSYPELPIWLLSETSIHLFILSITFLLTWTYSIKGDWVSDDWEGVQKFSDRFQQHKDQKTGEIVKEEVIDFYEQQEARFIDMGKTGPMKVEEKDGKIKVRIKNRGFNPYIEFPGSIIRWCRLNLAAKYQIIGKNKKGHEVWGYVQSPKKHHTISLIIHFCNALLAYSFLIHVTNPTIAFLATLLFIIHPVTVQAVAWVSGIGYLLSLFWTLLSLNVCYWIPNPYIHVPIVSVLTFLVCCSLLSGLVNFIVLALLGFWWAAFYALAVSIFCYFKQGIPVKKYRVTAFKEQNMGRSTYWNWRKPIVMIKSFWYYTKMIVFPKRLGLYHEWGYHYDEKIERIDKMFILGLISLIGLGIWFWFGSEIVRLGIVWMVIYLVLFLNLITAQQWVVDRYAFISSLGYCILFAVLLSKWPIVCAFLIGLYLMRTLVHLPTFDNELKFYESNLFNFRSEVAMGNYGVTWMRLGYPGMAHDIWRVAATLNTQYDVPAYNIYSILKTNGQFPQAKEWLIKCLNAKVCHFDKVWTKELEELDKLIQMTRPLPEYINRVNAMIKEAHYERI